MYHSGFSLTPYLESFTPTFGLRTPVFPRISSNLHCGTPTFSKRCLWDSYFQNPSENPESICSGGCCFCGSVKVLGNFQCQGILLIWIIVEQGSTVLAVGAGVALPTMPTSSAKVAQYVLWQWKLQ